MELEGSHQSGEQRRETSTDSKPPWTQRPATRRFVSRVKIACRTAFDRAMQRRIVGLASESAFWLSLAFIPLAAVSTLLVARLALKNDIQVAPLLNSIPPGAQDWVTGQVESASAYRSGQVAPMAAVMFIWLASSGVHGLFDAFEVSMGVVERPWWHKRLVAMGYCIVLAIGMGLIALVASGVDRVIRAVGGDQQQAIGAAEAALRFALSTIVDFGLTLGLYRLGMRRDKRVPLLPAAIAAVTLQVLLGWAYAVLVRKLGDSSEYLAGIAAFVVTMTAIFLYSLSLLMGLVVSGIVHEIRAGELGPRDELNG